MFFRNGLTNKELEEDAGSLAKFNQMRIAQLIYENILSHSDGNFFFIVLFSAFISISLKSSLQNARIISTDKTEILHV